MVRSYIWSGRGQVIKRLGNIVDFDHEKGKDFKKRAPPPPPNFSGSNPSPGVPQICFCEKRKSTN